MLGAVVSMDFYLTFSHIIVEIYFVSASAVMKVLAMVSPVGSNWIPQTCLVVLCDHSEYRIHCYLLP